MNNLIVGQVVRSAFLLFGVTFFFQSNQLLGQPSLVDYDILAQELNIDPRTAEAAKSAVNFFRVIIDRPEIFPEALDSIKSFEVNDKETAQNLLKETDYLRAEIQIQSANIRNDYFMAVDAAVQTLFQELEIADLNITNDPNADALIVNTAQMLASDLIKNGVKRKLLREKFKVERELDSLLDNKITPLKNKVIENIEANKQNYLEAAAYVSEEHAMRTNYNNYLLQECILEFMNKNYSPWSSEWLEHDCKNDLRYFSSSNKDSSDFQIAIRKLEWHEKTEIPLFKKSAINYLKRSLRKNPKSKEAWYLLYKNSEDIFLKHEFINYAFLLDPNKYEREFKNSLKVTHNFIQDLVSMDSIGFETNKKNFDIIKSIEEYNQAEYLKLAILADSPKFTNFLISYMIQENDLCNNQDLIFKEDSYQVFDLFLKTCEFDHVSLINNLINNHSKNCLKYLNRLYPDLVANFFKENDLRVETLKVAYKYNLIAKDKMPSNLLSELKISFNNIDSIFINEKYLKKNTSAYVLKNEKINIRFNGNEILGESFDIVIGEEPINYLELYPAPKPSINDPTFSFARIYEKYELNDFNPQKKYSLNELLSLHEEFNKANEEGILMYEKTINGFISETRKKFKNLMSTGNYYLINNERRNFNSKIDLIDSLINSKQVDLLNLIPHATLFYKVRFEGKKRKLDKEATLTREEILDNGKLTINIYDENDPFNAILEIPKPIYKITIANGELVKTFKVNNGKILNIEECFNNECDYFREKESVFSSINSHESYLKSGSLIRSELGWLALDSKESNGKISFIDMGNNQIYYMDILKINNKIQEVETSYSMYSGNEMLLNKLYAFNIY